MAQCQKTTAKEYSKEVEILIETINGVGIITLSEDCAAHTTNAIFLAPETIYTESQIITFNHTNLNTQGHNSLNILNSETSLSKIIKKAKIISENHKTNEKVSNLRINLCIAARLIIFTLILLFMAWMKIQIWGAPIFICFRLFSGLTRRNQDQNQGADDEPNVR